MQSKRRKVSIQRTAGEWDFLLSSIPGNDLNKFLNKEIVKLDKKFKEAKINITRAKGEKVYKSHYYHPDLHDSLTAISKLMKRPIATIIDELIIAPNLRSH